MRKLLIGLALSVLASAAQAQWVLVAENDIGTKFYVDPETKRRTANVVRIWTLQDYTKPLPFGDKEALSSRLYSEYDCSERTRHVLQLAALSGRMATGETLLSVNQPNAKEFVAPGTVTDILLNHACK
jgi:hypothetical protein